LAWARKAPLQKLPYAGRTGLRRSFRALPQGSWCGLWKAAERVSRFRCPSNMRAIFLLLLANLMPLSLVGGTSWSAGVLVGLLDCVANGASRTWTSGAAQESRPTLSRSAARRATAQDPAALSEQAQKLAGEQHTVEAEKLWKQAIELSPNFFPALFNLG